MGNTVKPTGVKRRKSPLRDVFKSIRRNVTIEQDIPNCNLSNKELSVYGFIRKIGEDLLSNQDDEQSILLVIPSSIYKLCYKYYINSTLNYLYLWCASPIVENYISCINTKDLDSQPYRFDLKRSNNKIRHTLHDKKFSSSFLVNYVSNSIIPKQYNDILNIYENDICAMFRIGGKFMLSSSEESCISSKCNIILFNAPDNDVHKNRIINGYIEDLPDLNEANSCVASIYDATQNIIYNVGGLNNMKKIQKTVNSLNMNHWKCETNASFKWKNHGLKLNLQRYRTCLCWIGGNDNIHDNIIVCGGCNGWVSPTTDCEMIKIDEYGDVCNIIKVSNMNYERAFVGAFQCESNKIVIGGGILRENSAYTIEFFDGNVNKWILYQHRTKFRHDQAVIWCDSFDSNVIYIGGYNYSNLGSIEWIDIRENCNNWRSLTNVKNQSDIFNFFKLVDEDEQIKSVDYWNRRHLLI